MVTAVNTQALARSLLRPADWLDTGTKSPPVAEDQQAAVVRISAEGVRQAREAPGTQDVQTPPGGAGNGPVTPQASQAAEPPAAPAGGANAGAALSAAPAGGQAPATGAGGGGAASSTASTPSASQTYQPADTNQDGQVSPMEQTAYEAKLAADKQAKAEANAPRAAEVGAAVKAYEAVDQLGAAG